MPTQLTTRQLAGHQAKEKNLARDPLFYVKLGRKGGIAPHSTPRGFAAMTPEQVKAAGRKGGTARRGKKYPKLPIDKFQQEQLDELGRALQLEANQVQ